MNKQKSIEEAVAIIPDGATILVGGFGSPGTPFTLLNEIRRQGQQHLTLIKNDANEPSIGISTLIENGQVDTLIATHIGLNRTAIDMMNTGQLEVVLFPQGILAEKIRIAGAGCYGFLSDIGVDTELVEKTELIEWQGQSLKVETALYADYALIHAHSADTLGNLVYRASARNFNPIMAMAADCTIVETPNLLEVGALDPDAIHTPCAFVSVLVGLSNLQILGPEYAPMENHLER